MKVNTAFAELTEALKEVAAAARPLVDQGLKEISRESQEAQEQFRQREQELQREHDDWIASIRARR